MHRALAGKVPSERRISQRRSVACFVFAIRYICVNISIDAQWLLERFVAMRRRAMFRRRYAFIGAALCAFSVSARAAGPVSVLYAGSLVNLMEHGVGPAFDKTGGYTFQGFAGGSKGLANQIKGQLAARRRLRQRHSQGQRRS